ncbi:RIP metalloprotease RseP [Streptococcus cuniculipharyngis]|uniref:Zinc metalloprotease n=1 Tax=Streptococcus cuniculipharyngis TaxID=1562651 RepID=A0A5C5SB72_9STRE|nr:RIP metalloprotease RseP [Streptococcus cuniculipharyngis]TWS97625.1 RIP metalloprotease RseP [Streptococcus cuniculipharyngis]
MLGILTFIFIFGVIVLVHEFGHFYFAKKSGILVREFAIGMGPKIFSHRDKEGTLYTIRILPIGGYVRMAGWGDDQVKIKTGQPATITLDADGRVSRINLSNKQVDHNSLPIAITAYDLEDQLELSGQVLDDKKTYLVNPEATIVETDGTELRIAPLDVQYQNASVLGKLITNFAGPMNNFILAFVVFTLLAFIQGGVADPNSNQFQVTPNGAVAQAGLTSPVQITKLQDQTISNWEDLSTAVDKSTKNLTEGQPLTLTIKEKGQEKQVEVTPKQVDGQFLIGVSPGLKTGILDKLLGGINMTLSSATSIFRALQDLIFRPNLNKLGGPVAIYRVSSDAANNGFDYVLYLLASLSINIGIFNLLPIPVLDGGKILFNLVEAVRRKPLKQETETYITFAGLVIMLIIMVAVTWNDIMRTFF